MKFFAPIVLTVFCLSLIGCGKSEATKAAEQRAVERHDARQKFKEAVAAVVVRTKSATYNEYRQSRLDLETCFEANKAYLTDVQNEFSVLSRLMEALDIVWSRDVEHPLVTEQLWVREDVPAMIVIRPSFASKADHARERSEKDPDFIEHNYVSWGLSKTQEQADSLLNLLTRPD